MSDSSSAWRVASSMRDADSRSPRPLSSIAANVRTSRGNAHSFAATNAARRAASASSGATFSLFFLTDTAFFTAGSFSSAFVTSALSFSASSVPLSFTFSATAGHSPFSRGMGQVAP